MNEDLTSRQRVRKALEHKEGDRVPIDFGGMRSTGISTIAYNNLRKKLGIKIVFQGCMIFSSSLLTLKKK